MSKTVTKEQWVEVFKATGLDHAQMDRWHQHFERLYPEGHQGFLEWLALPAAEIAEIRREAAKRA